MSDSIFSQITRWANAQRAESAVRGESCALVYTLTEGEASQLAHEFSVLGWMVPGSFHGATFAGATLVLQKLAMGLSPDEYDELCVPPKKRATAC